MSDGSAYSAMSFVYLISHIKISYEKNISSANADYISRSNR